MPIIAIRTSKLIEGKPIEVNSDGSGSATNSKEPMGYAVHPPFS
jgi:hypothetical protein